MPALDHCMPLAALEQHVPKGFQRSKIDDKSTVLGFWRLVAERSGRSADDLHPDLVFVVTQGEGEHAISTVFFSEKRQVCLAVSLPATVLAKILAHLKDAEI